MLQTVKDLINISQYAGLRADYTQGGGGNTSVKNEKNGIMLIKASGYRLKDVTETNAYVAVNRKTIADYYNSVNIKEKKDYEKESAKVASSAVVAISGMPVLRPSVEVGFHALLKKYVIHTHSVYANILACSEEGEKLAEKIFKNKDFGFIFLPYINPGFDLTLGMKKAVDEYVMAKNRYPEVIFMKNHGLVVTCDDKSRVKSLNEDVNYSIRKYFGIKDDLSKVNLKVTKDGFKSETPIVCEFVKGNGLTKAFLDENPLYPDQLVYLNNTLEFAPETIAVKNGEVCYNTDERQATLLEETLAAYLFVITAVEKAKLNFSKMSEKEVYFINHWEAEKYRRSVK